MTGSQQLILGEGAGGSGVANYIEDVFSTYLYTGTNAAQTITNGIDLSTYGGLVWTKSRDDGSLYHVLSDSATGPNNILRTNSSNAPFTYTAAGWSVPVFNANGYTTSDSGYVTQNAGGFNKFASWTFRKQPKFFDVVTYTGNGSDQNIAHNLGSVPGFVVIKRTNTTGNWSVWHRSIGNNYLLLNTTNAQAATGNPARTVTSTTFQIYGNFPDEGANGSSYVMYLFAHDAGGFGLTGTDNVISCGSYTGNGSATGPTVTLGYEPQWVLIKNATFSGAGWLLFDNMRGMTVTDDAALLANTSGSEFVDQYIAPTATGFNVQGTYTAVNGNGDTMVYIAIRRGPMRTPTTGTSVFSAQTGTYSAGDSLSVGFPADMYIDAWRTGALYRANYSRLVNFANSNSSASQNYLKTNTGDAEVTTSQAPSLYNLWNTTARVGSWNQGVSEVWWMFRRAPGFFDVVCYTFDGSTTIFNHNLGVSPELIITKQRTQTFDWYSWGTVLGANKYIILNSNAAATSLTFGTAVTATTFQDSIANSNAPKVAYLFASCPGVSKVGSYTGTGALQTINCGFTGGARFVLIKRTDSTGDWFTYDSARGITSGNDPYLLLNSTAAEVTGTNYVDTTSVGFQVTAAAPAGLNANGGTYIFLAIA